MTGDEQPRPTPGALAPRPAAGPPAPSPRGHRRALLIAGAALLALATVLLTLVLLGQKDDRERADSASRRSAVAAETARLRRIQAPRRATAAELRPAPGATRAERLAARAALYEAARASILRDARRRVTSGELAGPITGVSCRGLSRAPEAPLDHTDPERRVGRYSCIAVKGSGAQVAIGHAFVAALDFRAFAYVWCRQAPKPSERGKALAFVRLDRACLAARGRALDNGYAAVPDDG